MLIVGLLLAQITVTKPVSHMMKFIISILILALPNAAIGQNLAADCGDRVVSAKSPLKAREQTRLFTILLERMGKAKAFLDAQPGTTSALMRRSLNKLTERIERALGRPGQVSYTEYIEIGVAYAYLMEGVQQLRGGGPMDLLPYTSNSRVVTQYAAALIALEPYARFVFAHWDLSIKDFNEVSGDRVFYLGLTDRPVEVDFRNMGPLFFMIHDLFHAMGMLRNLFPGLFEFVNVDLGTLFDNNGILEPGRFRGNFIRPRSTTTLERFEALRRENIAIREEVFNALRVERDPLLHQAVHAIWFQLFHEAEVTMSWSAIFRAMEVFLGLDDQTLLAQNRFLSNEIGTVRTLRPSFDNLGRRSDEETLASLKQGFKWLLHLARARSTNQG